jgi:uncharacterized protein (TIRG00374 family)
MSYPTYKVTRTTFILPLVGLVAFFLYLYLFNVDIPAIIAKAKDMNLSIYFLAGVFMVLDTLFFSLSWRALLNFLSVKLSALKAFLYVWYGIFIDIIIPAESVSGEISRVYLVEREHNGTSGKVIASLVVHRLISMGTNLVTVVFGMFLLLIQGHFVFGLLFNLALFLVAVTTFFLVLLVSLCIKENWTLKVVDVVIGFLGRISRKRWNVTKIREDAVKAARMFHGSMKEFRQTPKTLSLSLFLNLIGWFFNLSVSYLVFVSLGFPVDWSVIIVTWSIVMAVKSIPIGVPFEVGLPEITMATLYVSLGVPPDIAATSTILTRILTVWFRFFVGFGVQEVLEIKAIRAKPHVPNHSLSVENA